MPVYNPYSALILVSGFLLGGGCLLASFHFFRRKRLIDDLPTSKTMGVFIGLTELTGTAEAEAPLTSYLAGVRCVYYSYKVEEQWQRTVTESYTDAQGNHRTRTRTESGWKTILSKTTRVPVFLKDDTGIIRVLSDGAQIHADRVFNRTCSRKEPLYYAKGPAESIASSTHWRRFTEEVIPLHAQIYVVGQARQRQDVVAAEIAFDKKSPVFLISTRDEMHHSSRFGRWYWFWLLLGLTLVLSGVAIYHTVGRIPSPVGPLLLGAAGFYFLLVLVGWIWNAYNSLVRLRQRVKQGWSQIEVELERRAQLIPNIVEMVKAYSCYEKSLQIMLAEIRSRAEGSLETGTGLQQAAPVLTATAEAYPELKASQQFLKLQSLLSETEQRLALIRDYYNQVATFYNTRLQILPDRYLAAVTGFKPRALLAASSLERAPVTAHLAD
ncbi:MAG: LemA family protein [Dehalococcoidaceae bacterium]|nr:LemA family protein [Dehalococcoidaceae bacterium]